MEGDNTGVRKFLSVIGILLIVGASYLNLLGIMEANTTNDKNTLLGYIISGNLINGIAVLCLIILTINSTSLSSFFKVFLIVILLVGLVGELYLISTELYSKNYVNYIVLIFNLLIRTYYLIYYFNESWAMFPGGTFTRTIERVIVPSEGAKVNQITDPEVETFKKSWQDLFRQARTLVGQDNFDEISREKAYSEVIVPAIRSKDMSRDRLKDAATYLKDKSGKQISNLVFGGKKRR